MVDLPESIMSEVKKAVDTNADAAVTVLDTEGKYHYISPSVEKLYGYSPEAGIGHHFSEFIEADDVIHLNLAIQDLLLTGESISPARHIKLKGGGSRRERGAAIKLTDEATGDVYILSIGRPCD